MSCQNNPEPPTLGLTKVGMVMCNVDKRINVNTIGLTIPTIPGHIRPGVPKDIPIDPWIVNYVATFLNKHGLKSEI